MPFVCLFIMFLLIACYCVSSAEFSKIGGLGALVEEKLNIMRVWLYRDFENTFHVVFCIVWRKRFVAVF